MAKKKTVKNQTSAKDLQNSLARLLADYDNFKKRMEAEKTLWVAFSSERIITKLLPVLDNFELALIHTKDSGLAIAVSEFKRILQEEGLVAIDPKPGDNYNHELHEVVEAAIGGKEGTIAETLIKGWQYQNGKVLRFARVKVYK